MDFERWRLEQGLTNNRVAEMLGVDKSTVSRIRRGVSAPMPDTANAIVALTKGKVTLQDLYGGKNRDRRETAQTES